MGVVFKHGGVLLRLECSWAKEGIRPQISACSRLNGPKRRLNEITAGLICLGRGCLSEWATILSCLVQMQLSSSQKVALVALEAHF